MPTFRDSDNLPPLLPAGDYIYKVVEFSSGISAGGKTSGSDKYELVLEFPGGAKCRENLIDHDSCSWKIDTFLKSAGVKIPKGAEFKFTIDERGDDVSIINPLGLKGSCKLRIENYPKKGEDKEKPATWTGKSNRVEIFYTDKPKIPRKEPPQAEAAAEESDDPKW